MEDQYSLEGKLVNLFLRGSWEFTGRVEFASKDKVVLMSDMGSLVIYKENIVAAMIIDEKNSKETIEEKSRPSYDLGVSSRNARPPGLRLDFDSDQQDYYGAVIPEDMLSGMKDSEVPVSFSISMSEMKNAKPKENLDGSTEKTSSYRGKDKA
jgi:hypothetical protein